MVFLCNSYSVSIGQKKKVDHSHYTIDRNRQAPLMHIETSSPHLNWWAKLVPRASFAPNGTIAKLAVLSIASHEYLQICPAKSPSQ